MNLTMSTFSQLVLARAVVILLLALALLLLVCVRPSSAWLSSSFSHPRKVPAATPKTLALYATSPTRIVVPASELDTNLTKEERTVVSVVRSCGPAVAYVTSVQPLPADLVEPTSSRGRGRRSWRRNNRRGPSQKDNNKEEKVTDDNTVLPRGQPLGSGSGFMVSSDGYIVTNYHVVEAAYQRIAAAESLEGMVDDLVSNITSLIPWNTSVLASKWRSNVRPGDLPRVYVRISSDTNYQECRIVNVKEDLDIAVLKIVSRNDNSTLPSDSIVTFGSSSDLLVGQSLVAIGNPFGLDNSVTTGVVSALNRDLDFDALGGGPRRRGRGPSRPLRNCIQTDAVRYLWFFFLSLFNLFIFAHYLNRAHRPSIQAIQEAHYLI